MHAVKETESIDLQAYKNIMESENMVPETPWSCVDNEFLSFNVPSVKATQTLGLQAYKKYDEVGFEQFCVETLESVTPWSCNRLSSILECFCQLTNHCQRNKKL